MLDGTLRPGVQLAEEQLVEALGVSRNTVREALQRLSAQRLVEHHRHRGVFVRRLGRDDLADLCGLRRSLECGALREAAARGTVDPDAAATVLEAAHDGERAAAADDWDAAGTANASVHLALAALAGNTRIDEEMRGVVAELRLAFVVLPDARAMHEPYVARNVALATQVADGPPARGRRRPRRVPARRGGAPALGLRRHPRRLTPPLRVRRPGARSPGSTLDPPAAYRLWSELFNNPSIQHRWVDRIAAAKRRFVA